MFEQASLLKRLSTVANTARVAAFLASDGARTLTGAILNVSDGESSIDFPWETWQYRWSGEIRVTGVWNTIRKEGLAGGQRTRGWTAPGTQPGLQSARPPHSGPSGQKADRRLPRPLAGRARKPGCHWRASEAGTIACRE